MAEQAELAVFEGPTVRLFAGFARWRANFEAQRTGRDAVIEQMLFDAGRAGRSRDLLAGFWREDAAEMDWLEDFLCDPATDRMMAVLQAPDEDDELEEEEMLYTKMMLVEVPGMDADGY